MLKSELITEFSKLELVIDSVADMVNGQYHESAAIMVKRLSQVTGEFKAKLLTEIEAAHKKAEAAAQPPPAVVEVVPVENPPTPAPQA